MFDPYGKVTVSTNPGIDNTWFTSDDTYASQSAIGNPWTFTGRRLDGETGLMYYRNRIYSTELGRFCQRDPAGYMDGWSLYLSVLGVGKLDPLGLCEFTGPGWTPYNPKEEEREKREKEEAEARRVLEAAQQAAQQSAAERFRQADEAAKEAARNAGKGFYEQPGTINCLGFACGLNKSYMPIMGSNWSIKDAIEDIGFTCTKWNGKTEEECIKHCGVCSHVVMAFVYTYKRNPENKCPVTDKWITTPNPPGNVENDYHAFKYTPNEGWKMIPNLGPQGRTPKSESPKQYWSSGGWKSMSSLCCCKKDQKSGGEAK
jgi:RHS repeat-associated protein